MSHWGKRLQEIRLKHKLTQSDLAQHINVDVTAMSRYERGTGAKQMPTKFKDKLLTIFSLNEIHYVDTGRDTSQNIIGNTSNSSNITQNSNNGAGENALSAEEKTLIKYFRKRDGETQEKIMAFALTGKCD